MAFQAISQLHCLSATLQKHARERARLLDGPSGGV